MKFTFQPDRAKMDQFTIFVLIWPHIWCHLVHRLIRIFEEEPIYCVTFLFISASQYRVVGAIVNGTSCQLPAIRPCILTRLEFYFHWKPCLLGSRCVKFFNLIALRWERERERTAPTTLVSFICLWVTKFPLRCVQQWVKFGFTHP